MVVPSVRSLQRIKAKAIAYQIGIFFFFFCLTFVAQVGPIELASSIASVNLRFKNNRRMRCIFGT